MAFHRRKLAKAAVNAQPPAESASTERCAACTALVARQPIFNTHLEVSAYELLYRRAGATGACFENPAAATAHVIVSAALDIGLSRLVGGVPAYINFPRELIVSLPPLPVSPEHVVIEVLEDVRPDPEVLAGLESLRNQGFRIALDDFEPNERNMPLLEFANIAKIDVQVYAGARLKECVELLKPLRLDLVAEKIETWAELKHCQELGFDGYQGYFLQRPETISAGRVPTDRLANMKLLVDLHDPLASIKGIESSVSRDAGLCYRLLRCINSSYYQLPRAVTSIHQAIVLLGFAELRKVCVVVMLAGFDDRPLYVGLQACVRARMCESLSVRAGLRDSDTYFMAGLLSNMDVLLGMPIEDALLALPLSSPVRRALLLREGSIGAALNCACRYEQGLWEDVDFMSLPTQTISELYREAVGWGDRVGKMIRTAS